MFAVVSLVIGAACDEIALNGGAFGRELFEQSMKSVHARINQVTHYDEIIL